MPKFDDFDDDDLIDYDDEYYDDEEMTPEEEEEFMTAVATAKSLIGNRKISDQDVKDAVWDFEFDAQKAAKVLSEKFDKANKPKPAPPQPAKTTKQSLKRQDTGDNKPMSKLAALAQARAQKKEPSLSSSSSSSASASSAGESQGLASVSLLSKLGSKKTGSSGSSSPIGSESALSKLAKARERHKANNNNNTAPTRITVAPDEAKVTKKNSKSVSTLPEIDYNLVIDYPLGIRASPSRFGRLFCKRTAAYAQFKSPVANTVFLPADTTEIKKNFEKPSPDDVVLNAQEMAGFVEKGMSNLKIADKEKEKEKEKEKPKNVRKLNVNEERLKQADQRPSINFVVIGHVDAGKSTLMGRLLWDAGVVDQSTINKYKRDSEREGKGSFHLAWVLDQTAEERRRGVTMDICMSQFETDHAKFTIVDAPGHKDFVPNMIAGSTQADYAVLVVDSSTNAFESGFALDGQTKEHAILVRSLGVDSIIVAVNKLDTSNWSRDRFEEISIQLGEFLGKIGFKKEQMAFVPTSGLQGDNVTKKSNEVGLTSWYKGNTLLQALEQSKSTMKDHNNNLRMLINDVSVADHTSDLTVSGRIDTGSVQAGEQVHISPSDSFAQVKSVLSGNGAEWAVAGQNVTLKLQNIEQDQLKVGYAVSNLEAPIKASKSFSARVILFDIKRPLLIGTKLIVHRGRTNEQAKISKIVASIDKTNGQVIKQKPRHLISNQTADVEITMENAIPLEEFKSSKELGRVILRKDGATVAAGIVNSVL